MSEDEFLKAEEESAVIPVDVFEAAKRKTRATDIPCLPTVVQFETSKFGHAIHKLKESDYASAIWLGRQFRNNQIENDGE